MNDIFEPAAEETVVEKVEAQPQDEPQGVAEDGGAPTAPKEDPHVPLAALEAERKGRQDWKEKAIRAEEQLRQLQEQAQRPQGQQVDPLQMIQQQLINERFNTSEMMVKQSHPDAEQVVDVFMEAARANPALVAAMQNQRHPWDFAYKEGKRMAMLKEVGDNPAAYRERIKAEVLAELKGANPAPLLNLPSSLNGVRSVAARSAPGFTGPTPFESILPGR